MEKLGMNPLASIFSGRSILLTGHTGFKGSWLALWLQQLGAKVTGIALPPNTTPALFELANVADGMESHFSDIRDAAHLASLVRSCKPEIVFHLAAQPLVRASYRDPLGTFSSNIMGTAHLLDALRGLESVRVVVTITTDKVYHNLEHPYPYRETDALGGHDPYSASKAASEIVIASYRDAFFASQGVAVASARAGNVIGGGDWSEDRLIPDAIRAWQNGYPINIRHPQSIRPWQHVLEPLHGYLTLAETLWKHPGLAGPFNFGPTPHEAASVREIVKIACEAYGKGECIYGDSSDGLHEASWLTLETSKSLTQLGLKPKWRLEEAITRTMNWYRAQAEGANARNLCLAEIASYEAHQ